MGAYPVIAAVVLLSLFLHPLLEQALDLLLGEAQVLQGLDLVPVGAVG